MKWDFCDSIILTQGSYEYMEIQNPQEKRRQWVYQFNGEGEHLAKAQFIKQSIAYFIPIAETAGEVIS